MPGIDPKVLIFQTHSCEQGKNLLKIAHLSEQGASHHMKEVMCIEVPEEEKVEECKNGKRRVYEGF